MSAMVFVCAILASAPSISAQTLPTGWTSANIGSTGGGATSSNGTWLISGSGANIWDAADAFQFTSVSVSGDFEIVARLSSWDPANQWSKAGLMVRESTAANAKNAYVMFSSGTGPALQYRATTGGTTARVTGSAASGAMWLRLVRQGTRFTASRSADRNAWTTIGSATVSMASTVRAGFAVTSRDAASIATATFTGFDLELNTSAPATTWTAADVGAPAIAGSSSNASGTFTVTGAGRDILGSSDQFQFYYQTTQGDAEIIARVSSFQAPWLGSKAGVMIRQSLAANSQHAFMLLSRGYGYAFQRRAVAGGGSSHTDGPGSQPPGWVRIVREGDLMSAYQSTNGSTWTLVGTDRIPMSGTVYVGLAVSSVYPTAPATATFTNVSVRTPTPGSNQPPSVTLTAPSGGATYTAPANIGLSASASDSDGSISRVEFYRGTSLIGSDSTSPYSITWSDALAGTHPLTAVAIDNEGATATSAVVTVTVTAPTNQPPTVSFVSPAQGSTYTAGATILIQAAASDADGIERVDLYRGTTLLKSDRTNPYSVNWTNVPAGTHTLTATARDITGQTRTATMTVTVNAAGNQAPSVSITAPAANASYTAPATVSIQATASDADGTIARVEFYRGSTLISTDTTSPYTASWTNAPAGNYTLTARAYDNQGASRTSTGVAISIASGSNQLPTVSLTSPTAGATFNAPASISMAATAADADGSIARVDFYAGTQLVATDTSSPYTASWTNVPAGTYSLTAVARDNSGGTRTSSAVSVTVGATSRPVTLVFNASADHATNVTSYTVAIYRSVDSPTASPVATQSLGKPTPTNGQISVSISTLVNPLGAGSYYAVVRALGPGGTTASTASSTFSN